MIGTRARRTWTAALTLGAAVLGCTAGPPTDTKTTRRGTAGGYASKSSASGMSTSVSIGLPVCSHVNGTLCTATFDNVTVNP